MSKRTKKVGSSGRLGVRYGVRVRKRIADIEAVAKGRHECPKCKAVAMSRTANGIWFCNHCGAILASSSYMPTKPVAVRREVAAVLAEAEAKEAAKKEAPKKKKEAEPEAEEEEIKREPEPEELPPEKPKKKPEELKSEKPRKRKKKE
jgi:large subunit ribosomal protein L37Ae